MKNILVKYRRTRRSILAPAVLAVLGMNRKAMPDSARRPCFVGCGKWADGITAEGSAAKEGHTAAAGPDAVSPESTGYIYGQACGAEDPWAGVKENTGDIRFNRRGDMRPFGASEVRAWIKLP